MGRICSLGLEWLRSKMVHVESEADPLVEIAYNAEFNSHTLRLLQRVVEERRNARPICN